MFEFFLSFRKSGTRARLGISWTVRVLALVFTLATGFATFAYGDVPPLGVVLTLVLAFLVFYEESWTFDRESGTCTFRLGLVGLNRRKSWELEGLESVTVSRFTRGIPPGGRETQTDPGSTPAGNPAAANTGSQVPANTDPFASRRQPGFFERRYRRTVTRLCLVTRKGETLTLETGSPRTHARMEPTGKALAAWLQIPFRQE